jgi:DNA-directed RNA polymerase subunit RPC12/RpoP
MVYKTGEKPGVGTYLCTNCDQKITLDDSTDTLPPCPKCKNTEFIKL